MSYPAGSFLVCPSCGKRLYEFTRELHYGDVLAASAMRRVEAVEPAAPSAVIACPDCGPLRFGNLIPTWLVEVPE